MEFYCKECSKQYKSYKSLWNHSKKFHNTPISRISAEYQPEYQPGHQPEDQPDISQKVYPCKNCSYEFKHVQSRWKHEQKCNLDNNIEISDISTNNLEKIIKTQCKQIEELKDLILKSMKIHPKTLTKINKQLINNGIVNINNQNTINIIPLGKENLSELLTEKDKLRILNKRGNGLKEIVDLVHISDKFKQFKNVYITNLQNTIGYKFDSKNNQFIAVNKSELLDDIIDCRMYDIEQFYDNLEERLDPETSKIVKRFIDRMNNNDDELKGIKKEEIKLFLYNSREKIKPIINIEL